MGALLRKYGSLILLTAGWLLLVSTALLHRHIALAVLVGALFGLVLAMPRRAAVMAAILATPFALLTLVLSTTAWRPSIVLSGDFLFVVPVGLLLGGAAICSLLPYAVARWSRISAFQAFGAWLCGLLVSSSAVGLAAPILLSPAPTKEGGVFSTPETEATIRSFYYADWLGFNGLTRHVEHFDYEGRIVLNECFALPFVSWSMRIPHKSRMAVERFLFGKKFPEEVRKWFSDYQNPESFFFCSTTTNEEPDGGVVVAASCAPGKPYSQWVRNHPTEYQEFVSKLPMIQFQAPGLIPSKYSMLTITAPRGCIAETFPATISIKRKGKTETLRLRVGFPRDAFSLFEPQRMLEDPMLVHVELAKPHLRGAAMLEVLRALNSPAGLAGIFVLTIIATRGLSRRLGRCILQYRLPMMAWRRTRELFVRYGRDIGFFLRSIALWVICWLALPRISLIMLVIMLDPTYWLAATVFLVTLFAIEVLAFIIRRLARKIPPPLPLAA
ncbi:hypothetical protein XI07_15755 [Bradyrhizobium sp. CCBAU 11445]|uniref:hypothetical protein n=1 Tax=unclassified Bradyrhizobium TaxID=2631580 RepID=UPI00230684AF|nr:MULTISPECIES: hypothetical protein [unclassified Bradyrhizobium]MDA9483441.1 hypothetical protein [Bradyrhizobium sp. CCBAU 11445]MDA9523324.1 hypothetical protein [Bradyrhizobium sp. CCBAU 11434]